MELQEIKKIEQEKVPLLPKLDKIQGSFKMIIPEEIEKKIRYLCNKVSEVEWSGVLFYTYKGSWEKEDLVITCKDIFVMDIGTQGYTEFSVNPDVTAYMCENMELLDFQMGLIHSHNKMDTFFSRTDTETLRKEGIKRNHFVSLIVNNAGTYTAGITRKLISKKTITESLTYETFEKETVEGSKEYKVEETVIEWCNFDIIKEGYTYSFCELDKRLEEIHKEKTKMVEMVVNSNVQVNPYQLEAYSRYGYGFPNAEKDAKGNINKDNQPTLFNFDYMDSKSSFRTPTSEIPLDFNLTDKEIHSMLLQLITGSIIITDESRDVRKLASSMEKVFDERFNRDMKIYRAWAEQLCEFLVYYPVSEKYAEVDESNYAGVVSMALISELEKLPKNKYINTLIDCLTVWIL